MQSQAIDSLYIATLKSLKESEEEVVFRTIFKHLSPLLKKSSDARNRAYHVSNNFEERINKCKESITKRVRSMLYEHENQLCLLYTILTNDMAEPSKLVLHLPQQVSAVLEKDEHKEFNDSTTKAYIYIACSYFMPTFKTIFHSPESTSFGSPNPEFLAYGLDFKQLFRLYMNEECFMTEILSKPLRIICSIPTLKEYDFYQQIALTDVFDMSNCLFSSYLIDASKANLIETYNYTKIIDFRDLFETFPKSNNSLLNAIERMKMTGILPSKISKIQPSQIKPFCLTFPINRKHFHKLRLFFERLPPQIVPLSKYDALSYGKGDESRLYYYRFATDEYWEHSPQSEFCSFYYLCNHSEVEWMSVPAEQYAKAKTKIQSWLAEIESLTEKTSTLVRGVQKMGQIVVIGAGHEYFWKVKKGNGLAVLLKWSILLKETIQLKKFVNITKCQQKSLEGSNNWLIYPHRRTILNYLSHQLQCLNVEMIRFLIKFIKSGINKQQSSFAKLCVKYQYQAAVCKQTLPIKYRICGICGRQILNMYCSFKQNAICLWCIPSQMPEESDNSRFQLNYMWKPTQFQQYFKNMMNKNDVREEDIRKIIEPYEHTFCEGRLEGHFDTNLCIGEVNRSPVCFSNHLIHTLPNLELHIFAKRNNLCSIESAIKLYSCKIRIKSEQPQMKQILSLLVRQIAGRQDRSRLRQQIIPNYHESNYVLLTLNLLSISD